MEFPEHLDTFGNLHKDPNVERSAIDLNGTGRDSADMVKERINLTVGDARYELTLFYTESAALRSYQLKKELRWAPVFRETSTNGRVACVFYIEQDRGDLGGRTGWYFSRALFRLGNVVVDVWSKHDVHNKHDRSPSENLSRALRNLVEMLKEVPR